MIVYQPDGLWGPGPVMRRAPLVRTSTKSQEETVVLSTHSLLRLHYERQTEIQSRAATRALLAAMNAEKRRARREAALVAKKKALQAKEERATFGWLSQRKLLGSGHFGSVR